MQKGTVIKMYGDPDISGAIADGMVEALQKEQVEVVQSEIDRQHIQRALLRVAVGNNKTAQDYACMAAKARGDYGYTRQHGRLYEAILGMWGLLWIVIYDMYDYFSEWNRRG